MTSNTKPTQTHPESGQALVEFALVLLFVILPFTFVLVDGAVTLYTQAALTNAAREGARAGSIYQAAAAPTGTFASQVAAIDAARATYTQQEVQRMIGPLLTFSACTTTFTYSPATPDLGNPYRQLDAMRVVVSCPRRLFFGLIGTSQITLQAQATMRIEPGGVAPSP
jgi:Flp pilus assembly protein TadG